MGHHVVSRVLIVETKCPFVSVVFLSRYAIKATGGHTSSTSVINEQSCWILWMAYCKEYDALALVKLVVCAN